MKSRRNISQRSTRPTDKIRNLNLGCAGQTIHALGLCMLMASSAPAASTINLVNRYAYAANLGWADWRSNPQYGVAIGEYVSSGYIHAPNVGWIHLGSGSPANGIHYQNNHSSDYGVNHDGAGKLEGLGWGANIGWVQFIHQDAQGAPYPGPRVNLRTGILGGWIYSRNVGWISLNNESVLVQTEAIQPSPDTDGDSLPDAWERTYVGNLTALVGDGDNDNDGLSNAMEVQADTHPLDASSALRITSSALDLNGALALEWSSSPTRLYRIQQRSSLDPGSTWENVPGFGPIYADAGRTTCRFFQATPIAHKFYRVQVLTALAPEFSLASPCSLRVTPDIATDGQKVYIDDSAVQLGSRVFLAGYRYNSPPATTHPDLLYGEGRERIYCGCQRVEDEEVLPFVEEGSGGTRYFFVVPKDAPSGEYTLRLLPPGGECAPGGIRFENCPPEIGDCLEPSLHITPSYIVSTLEEMKVHGNSEGEFFHPSEMSFTFASLSGKPFAGQGGRVALVMFSGSYPGGDPGSGHLTPADGAEVKARLPLFVGNERFMLASECREEALSFPESQEQVKLEQCSNRQAQALFSDHFEIGFSGAEFDADSSTWFDFVVTAGAKALGDYLGGPVGGTLGEKVGNYLTGAGDDDELEHLGEYSFISRYGDEWSGGINGPATTNKLGGTSQEGGDIDISVKTRRVGGPRILEWKVTLKSLTVEEGYDEGWPDLPCDQPNEVILHARTFLYSEKSEPKLPDTRRHPSGTGYWELRSGQTTNFNDGKGLNLGAVRYDVGSASESSAPESPLLYIEMGFWETDFGNGHQEDLLGLHSETIFLADLLSVPSGWTELSDEIDDHAFVRRAKSRRYAFLNGFAGSDAECHTFQSPPPPLTYLRNRNAQEGRIAIQYEVEVTWLKRMSR